MRANGIMSAIYEPRTPLASILSLRPLPGGDPGPMEAVMTRTGYKADFRGRTAIVTGGTSGIGAATVAALVEAGARVFFCGLEDDRGREVAEGSAGRAIYRHCDVREDRDMARLVELALAHSGRLDLAVNNAGISHPPLRLADIPPDIWRDVMATNADGVFHAMRHEIRAMQAGGGGAIVNVASILAARGAPWIAAYGASKHAVMGLTLSAARDYAGSGIRVNAVLPGPVDTPMFQRAMLEIGDDLSKYSGGLPPGGPGHPADVVAAILYLLGDAACYVNGAGLVVDGGVSAG